MSDSGESSEDAPLLQKQSSISAVHQDDNYGSKDKRSKLAKMWPTTEDFLKLVLQASLFLTVGYFGYCICYHGAARSRLMRIDDASYSDDCAGVKLAQTAWGSGLQVFPEDVYNDDTALMDVLAQRTFLADVAGRAKALNLFAYPTYPWAQWTWLKLLSTHALPSGSFAEFGVGLGGSSIFLAGLAKLHGTGFVGFDSFAGLPKDTVKDLPYFPIGAYDFRKTNNKSEQLDMVQSLVRQCGIRIPEDAIFVQGFFKDAHVPANASFSQLAFVHLDGDLYESIYSSLTLVYDRIPEGGIIAVDDFFHPAMGAKRAVEDFFRAKHPGKLPLLFPVFPGYAVITIKGHFADPSKGNRQNLLDGNFYSFDLIKGQPDIKAAVARSLEQTQLTYDGARRGFGVNKTLLCQLSVALDSAERLRQFLEDESTDLDGTEGAQIFRFMRTSVQFQDAESKELRLH